MSRARRARWAALGAVALLAGACRGRPPGPAEPGQLSHLVDSLRPEVERATGLRFRSPPRFAMQTREQVRAYIVRQMKEELPPERLRGSELTYKLLGMVPDSLSLERMVEEILTGQILGYFDPRTSTLYGVEGADPSLLRLTLAHEMVHALQHQYLPLDSILHDDRDNDRLAAAQAVLEGQANFASLVMLQGRAQVDDPEYWARYAELSRTQQSALGALAEAPMILRERLFFPYREGGAFMQWWGHSAHADTLPYGRLMPESSEQILHPERYASGDRPLALRFTSGPAALYEDDFGEIEIRILQAQLAGRTAIGEAPPIGWGGDRFRLYDTPAGAALVWYTAWDDGHAAARFRAGTGPGLLARARAGYRATLDTLTLGGRPALRFALAPGGWSEWTRLPQAALDQRPTSRPSQKAHSPKSPPNT